MAKKRKKRKYVREDDLAPGIAAGLTQGASATEALREHKPVGRPGVEVVRHMRDVEPVIGSRVPTPRFIGSEDVNSPLVLEFPDGRRFKDATKTFQPETVRAMQAGMICLKCLEPQAYAFEDKHLPGCEGVVLRGPRYMRDWQILDLAMEFEGERHIGPSRPLQEFLDEQDVRVEKRRFIKRVLDGHQGRVPKEWLRDATLLEGLTPQERAAIGAS